MALARDGRGLRDDELGERRKEGMALLERERLIERVNEWFAFAPPDAPPLLPSLAALANSGGDDE